MPTRRPQNMDYNGRASFWLRAVRDVGFPILVAAFYLYSLQPILQGIEVQMTQAVTVMRRVAVQQDELQRLLRILVAQGQVQRRGIP